MSADLQEELVNELAVIGSVFDATMQGHPEEAIRLALSAGETCRAEWFIEEKHGLAFGLVVRMAESGLAPNGILLREQWGERYPAMPLDPQLVEADKFCPTWRNMRWHVDGVRESYRRRLAVMAGEELTRRGPEAIEDVLERLKRIAEPTLDVGSRVLDSQEIARRLTDDLERRFNLNGELSGIATGFRAFDQMTDGLQLGEQTIIAARPSVGKTAIALNIVQHATFLNKVPTLFVSLEMSEQALGRRLLAGQTSMVMSQIRAGSYREGDFAAMGRFNARLSEAPITIMNGVMGLDARTIANEIKRAAKRGVRLVVIDYLQKIRSVTRNEKRTYEVAEVSGMIRAAAVENKVALVTLAQLNRESDKKERNPRLTDLADSGQIERDADTVALLHRPGSSEGAGTEALLIVAKQRDGETGIVHLTWDGPHCRFENPKPS